MNILAVDDDPVLLELLELILRQAGHSKVSIAASGFSALEILRHSGQQFDCLILDIEMPGMDGIELCKSIRKMPEYVDTPIIMLTAKSDTPSIEGAFVAGANDYVTKPFDVKNIAARLEIASRMTFQITKAPSHQSHQNAIPQQPGYHRFDLTEPLRFSQESRLTDIFSLGNYLLQLPKSRIEGAFVFAVQVDEIELLFDSCTSAEFSNILSQAAEAISKSVKCLHILSAYLGSGTFICISSSEIVQLWPDIETEMESVLNAAPISFGPVGQKPISLTMGRPIHPNLNKRYRVKPTFDRAIAALGRQSEAKAAKFATL